DQSADRIGKSGDEQAVITARVDAGNGARGVAAKAVRHEPLGVDERLRAIVGAALQREGSRDPIEQSSHNELSIVRGLPSPWLPDEGLVVRRRAARDAAAPSSWGAATNL